VEVHLPDGTSYEIGTCFTKLEHAVSYRDTNLRPRLGKRRNGFPKQTQLKIYRHEHSKIVED
jgi:hypothetical protein